MAWPQHVVEVIRGKAYRSTRSSACALAVALLAAACGTPPSVQSPPPQPTGPSASQQPPITPSVPAPRPSAQSLAEWKRQAAEKIHAANRRYVFAGPPPNPLRAVVVVEMTVASDGQVKRADLLRVPDHSRELGKLALATLNSASPLPPPPKAVISGGNFRVTETWLFRDDGQFQIRTIALPQSASL